MAFFLNEAANTYIGSTSVSLEEAAVDMLMVVQEYAELNESILVADFIIHEESRMLTEEEKQEKEGGFLSRVIEKVKGFARAVKDKVVAFFKSIANAVRKFFGRAKEKAEEKSVKMVTITKDGSDAFKEVRAKLENVHKAVSNESLADSKVSDYKKAVNEAVKSFNDIEGKVKKGIKSNKDKGSHEQVPLSEFEALGKFANEMDALAKEAEGRLKAAEDDADKAEKAADKAAKTAAAKTNKAGVQTPAMKDAAASKAEDHDEAKRLVTKVQAKLKAWQDLSTCAGKTYSISTAGFAVVGTNQHLSDAEAAKKAKEDEKKANS